MNKFKLDKKEKRCLLCVLIVLLFLFISSSMTYNQQKLNSNEVNIFFGFIEKRVSQWNIYYAGRWHNKYLDGGTAGFTQFIVRKLVHFFTYFILGLFSYIGLKRIFLINWTAPIFIWFSTIALAAFDEYHQYLTGDRTPSVNDIILDSCGSLCAIILFITISSAYKKIKKVDNIEF